jgi:hypothetical protein
MKKLENGLKSIKVKIKDRSQILEKISKYIIQYAK